MNVRAEAGFKDEMRVLLSRPIYFWVRCTCGLGFGQY
jgi:hypothetical protein